MGIDKSKYLKELSVREVFKDNKYEVPIYQRNYAWREKEIEQLIEDIRDIKEVYYLGSLIVNQKEDDSYEVIDGQQRLTTIYLLQKFLELEDLSGKLTFEARKNSNKMLKKVGSGEEIEEKGNRIYCGYQIIENYFKTETVDKDGFKEKLKKAKIIRVQVPKDIDLNEYFEIMNTRGEQLELHEIVKAKILGKLDSKEEKKVGALIWEACEEMDSYVQMNFKPDIRNRLFTSEWSSLQNEINSFHKIKETIIEEGKELQGANIDSTKSLKEILMMQSVKANEEKKEEGENERFESIISFSNFILQVNKINSKVIEEGNLDDKNLLKTIKENWSSSDKAREFLYRLLECRVLFDKYIIKRETTSKYEEGRWTLQKLEEKDKKPQYKITNGEEKKNKKLTILQSCLRITYTSPKTMDWINILLRRLIEDEKEESIDILEKYCREKVKSSNYEVASGFGFERIVFTYLDYILYRDGYKHDNKEIIELEWDVKFRNSIEHFYPQNPMGGIKDKWDEKILNSFGNLALITVSGNSKFSNMPPSGKIDSKAVDMNQSLKLKIMGELTKRNNNIWDKTLCEKHNQEMLNILKKELEK